MPLRSDDDIKNMTPDRKAYAAAKKLAKAENWTKLGRHEGVLWGTAIGSSDHYAVYVEGDAFECSCPSRKRPCKHALALALMDALEEPVPEAAPPDGHKWEAQERFYRSWE